MLLNLLWRSKINTVLNWLLLKYEEIAGENDVPEIIYLSPGIKNYMYTQTK